jgi:hypothetical protein
MIYDVTIVGFKPNTYGEVLKRLPEGLAAEVKQGKLLGCFLCEFGVLNRAFIFSRYESIEALYDDRARSSGNSPFGVGEYLNAVDRNAYRPLSFMSDIEIGEYGPFYEIRTYEIARGGLAETETAWGKVVEQRQEISKLLMVMASIDALPQRMLHIWPYKALNDRTSARAEASRCGIWPPPGGSNHLLSLKSEVFAATKFSPLS